MADLIGQRLDKYEITALLGEGGMAAVYRARQLNMNRDVAIKVIKHGLIDKADFVKRFEREAQTVASLSHSHIVKVFDYGQQGDLVYLVMELLTRGSLADVIRQNPLSLDKTSRMLDQIAAALDYAHKKGIIHRDLKPQNILLDEAGDAHLTDFGIVKLLTETTVLTRTGLAMGTPTYMPPEQWQGQSLDARADIYALGVAAFEMLTGQLPFTGDTPASIMYKHLQQPPPPLNTLRSDLPSGVEAVIQKALAKDRDQRFSSAGEMAAAFKAARAGGIPGAAPQGPKAVEATLFETPISPPARHRASFLVGGGALTVVLLLIGMLAILSGQRGPLTPTSTVPGMALQATDTAFSPSLTPVPWTASPGSVPNAATLAVRATLTANTTAITMLTVTSSPTRILPSPTTSPTPTVAPSVMPTQTVLSANDLENTVQAEMNLRLTDNAQTVVAGLTATATLWTATPTINIPATANARLTATQVAALQQAMVNVQATHDSRNQTASQATGSSSPTMNIPATATPGLSSASGGTATAEQLRIISPNLYAVLSGGAVVVTGNGSAFNNRVGVQVLDAQNSILGSALATIQAEAGAVGPWQTTVAFPQPAAAGAGYIVAYTVNTAGSFADNASIPITFAGASVPTALLSAMLWTATPMPGITPVSAIKPTVSIQSPASNSTVTVNQSITVQASSNHPDGVTRLELHVNNQQVDSKISQNPLGDQRFSANLNYTPTVTGTLTLTVIAYRNDRASDPATITVNVQDQLTAVPADNSSNSGQAYDPTCRARVDVNGLNFRQGPGQNYPPYQVLGLGTVVRITGRTADNTWWQGQISNTIGWMSASFITLLGICTNITVAAAPPPPAATATLTTTPAPTQATNTPAKADVVVNSITGPVSIILAQNGTATASYSITVQNAGAVATGQFHVGLVYPDGTLADLGAVPALAPNQSAIFSASVTFTAPGSARLTAIADKDNTVDESNETNNLRSLDVVLIKPTPLPSTTLPTTIATLAPTIMTGPVADLVFDSITLDPASPKAQQTFTVIIAIRNAGTIDAGVSLVQGVFQPGNETSSVAVPAIRADQTVTIRMPVTLQSSGVNQSGVITLDANNDINEGPDGETNNVRTITYTVMSAVATMPSSGTKALRPSKVTLVTPNGTITSSKTAFAWNALPNATQYILQVVNSNNQAVVNTAYDVASVCASQLCVVTPDVTLPNGTYTWRVLGRGPGGDGPWSNPMNFTVAVAMPVPLTATPVPLTATPVPPTATPVPPTPTPVPPQMRANQVVINYLQAIDTPDLSGVTLRTYFTLTDATGQVNNTAQVGSVKYVLDPADGETYDAKVSKATDPISVVLVLDFSGSMYNQYLNVKKGAINLVNSLPQDSSFAVIRYSDKVETVQELTKDKNKVINTIGELKPPSGLTCLFDAAYQGVQLISNAPPGRRAVIVFTGNRDRYYNKPCSTKTVQDVVNLATSPNARTPLYTIGMRGFQPIAEAELQNMAAASGGIASLGKDPLALFNSGVNALNAQFVAEALVYPRQGDRNFVLRVAVSGGTNPNDVTGRFTSSADYSVKPTATPTITPTPLPVGVTINSIQQDLKSKDFVIDLSVVSADQVAEYRFDLLNPNGTLQSQVTKPAPLNGPVRIPIGTLDSGQYTIRAFAIGKNQQILARSEPYAIKWEPTASLGPTQTLNPFPTETRVQLYIAQEDFQNGYMFLISAQRVIWVLYKSSDPNRGTWQSFQDTFVDGEPEIDPNLHPPSGTYQPKRSFGKLWRYTPGLRDKMGWAATPEFVFDTHYVYQPGGYLDNNNIYVARPGKHFIETLSHQTFALSEPDSSSALGTWERVG